VESFGGPRGAMGSKGGPRRTPAPEVDEEHLLDSLTWLTTRCGVQSAFALGAYEHVGATQSVKGPALVRGLAGPKHGSQ